MSDALREIIVATQAAFRDDAEKALATFKSESALREGLRSEVTMRHHELTVDEPEALGGTDAGPNPVELVLAALGTCQEITYRAYATAMGVPLDNVSVVVEGDIDLRGFFAVDESVRAGYQKVRVAVNLESPASEEQLQQLRDAVNAHCPVLDILSQPVDVELTCSTKALAGTD